MKITKSSEKIAKIIFQEIHENGKIDEKKLGKILTTLKKNPGETSIQILSKLVRLLEDEEKKKTLIIESPFEIEKIEEEKIKNLFEKRLNKKLLVNKKINKDLIGGMKIVIRDNEWENSVISQLNYLKGNL